MKSHHAGLNPSVEFIRLFFPNAREEEFAVRIAQHIALVLGEQVANLRPDSTMSEVFEWAAPREQVRLILAIEAACGTEINDELAETTRVRFLSSYPQILIC